MKKLLASLVLLVAVAGCQCGGATPAIKNPRPAARAAIAVAKTAWVLAANACITAAQEANDTGIAAKCADYMGPAHDLILSASEALDANWNNGAACDLLQGLQLVDQAAGTLPISARPTQAVLVDALAVAQDLAVGCGDAGVK